MAPLAPGRLVRRSEAHTLLLQVMREHRRHTRQQKPEQSAQIKDQEQFGGIHLQVGGGTCKLGNSQEQGGHCL